ncbi:uncharacterized protein (DUF58 family) [Motilibacter rhizosphaerae]|uniref:Uncharacterized protein (DUF58 family) n=1 Tax=Motilibacter rhizosphaerae TaxID=598652 RepID=A0A4Q7NWD8_9ACTN|nr:DUF58 domain-containing protein [Motilibacter rhizosphaerae]RZS91494.1 uncharacterized protein (DUF58 family) [Motilibacter rhizosphaerae]
MSRPAWAPAPEVVLVGAAALVVLVYGVVGGRVDVAVLAVAPLLAAERLLRRRPTTGATGRAATTVDAEGRITALAELEAPTDVPALVVRASVPGRSPAEAVVAVGGTRQLAVTTGAGRTGPLPAPLLEHVGLGPGAATRGGVGRLEPPVVPVAPVARRLPLAPLPARLRGLSGSHEARRVGEGGSLHDVHPFGPGDRLNRIDWRTTARRSPDLQELYVRRTSVLAEATVAIVLDSRDDLGPDPRTWARAELPAGTTSLELAREAAASLAQHYLAAGDRVALEDLGLRRRPVRAGAGRRHLDRLLDQLARTAPEAQSLARVRAPQLTSGALVYVLSTFLDDSAADLARQWRATGHRVFAVDVLPQLETRRLERRHRLALRVAELARTDRLAALATAGIPAVRWSGTPERELLALSRLERRR